MPVIGERAVFVWSRQPLVRPLIAFILGIVLSEFAAVNFGFAYFFFLFFLLSLFVHVRHLALSKALVSFFIHAAFLILGLCFHQSRNYEPSIPELFRSQQIVVRQLGETVVKKSNGEVRTVLTAEGRCYRNGDNWLALNQTIRITIRGAEFNSMPGTNYLLHALLKKPSNDLFPGSFDFESFCRRKSIDVVCSVGPNEIIPLNHKNTQSLYPIINLRNRIITELYRAGLTPNQAGIAGALLIGSRSEIDPELNQAYSRAGIVHVLAVSGMHVSLVFGSVLWLLRKILKQKQAVLIGLVVLWIYAMLAGMSASVVRSAWMFTLLAGSKLLVRSAVSSNALAGAAFIMLCINPAYLFDTGAQLSFAAVWGIQTWSKAPMFLYSRVRVIRYIVDSLWICLVAQCATLPFTLAYFGTFPVYFMLANLVAVPLSTCIIYIGLFSLLFSPLKLFSTFAFFVLKWSIDVLNSFTIFISSLPFASFDFGPLGMNSAIVFGIAVFTILFPAGGLRQKIIFLLFVRLFYSILILTGLIFSDANAIVYLRKCNTHSHIILHGSKKIVTVKLGNRLNATCERETLLTAYAKQMNLTFESRQTSSAQCSGLYFISKNSCVDDSVYSFAFLPSDYLNLSAQIIPGRTFILGNRARSSVLGKIYANHYRIQIKTCEYLKTLKYDLCF